MHRNTYEVEFGNREGAGTQQCKQAPLIHGIDLGLFLSREFVPPVLGSVEVIEHVDDAFDDFINGHVTST